jgi:hypothetical protein
MPKKNPEYVLPSHNSHGTLSDSYQEVGYVDRLPAERERNFIHRTLKLSRGQEAESRQDAKGCE